IGIHIRGVEEIDSKLEGALDEGASLVFLQNPFAPFLRSVRHHAETQARDFQARTPEVDVIHSLAAIPSTISIFILSGPSIKANLIFPPATDLGSLSTLTPAALNFAIASSRLSTLTPM